jgi:hypothetical protein
VTTPRAVRIPRPRPAPTVVRVPSGRPRARTPVAVAPVERRANIAGTQRALRLALVFVVVLAALYSAFILYDRTAPGGSASPETNGVLEFTVLFLGIAAGGAAYSLTAAPRAIEVGTDRVTVVGRWGRRRTFPRIENLTVHVVQRYPEGWLASAPVDLVEVWAEDTPRRSYLIESELFAGARPSAGAR